MMPVKGLKLDRGETLVIKRNEGEKVPDEPVFRGGPPPGSGNRGRSLPTVIEDIFRGSGGGRADVMSPGGGNVITSDVWDRGNNPFQVRPADYLRILGESQAAAQAAAEAAATQAAGQRIMPLLCC